MYYENFEKLCEMTGTRPAQVSRATGISTATFSSWKKGLYTPKNDKLQKVADYFGVPVECLRGEPSVQLDETIKASDLNSFASYLKSLGWDISKDGDFYCLDSGQVAVSIPSEKYKEFEKKIRNECIGEMLGFIADKLNEEREYLIAAHQTANPDAGDSDFVENDQEDMNKEWD